MSRLSKILPVFYFIIDVSLLVCAFFGSIYFFNENNVEGLKEITLAMAISLWVIIAYWRQLYHLNLNNGFVPRMISYSKTYLIFATALISLAYLTFDLSLAFDKTLLSFVLLFLGLNIVANSILINLICLWRRRAANIKYTLVIGVGEQAAKISQYFECNPDFGFRIKGYLSLVGEECRINPAKVIGPVKKLKKYLRENPIDEIIIALPHKSTSSKIKYIVHQADLHGIRAGYVPDYQGLFGKHCKMIHDGELEAVNVRQFPLDELYPIMEKAVFDFVFSAAILILLSPLFLAISIMIKVDSPGPVFYCPMRVGRGGKSFRIFKFRTMHQNDPVVGGMQSTRIDDPRITRVGSVLRKYNLDELPQFLNVFLGDMSVVGPRPHRNFLSQKMKEHYDRYMVRHYFKPGITGWAQVNGWRGPTENEMQIIQRTMHDLWYLENWSFMLDLKIIWQTIFSRKAYQNAF